MDLTLVFLFAAICATNAADRFAYYNGPAGLPAPKDWGSLGSCSGSRQSPINIVTKSATYDKNLKAFSWTGAYTSAPSGNYEMINNGHSLKLSGISNTEMSGGGLTGDWALEQFHMHWGSAMSNGSEHTMDGKAYAAAVHFVHYNKKYANFDAAIPKTDGLAIVGVFVKEEGSDNSKFNNILTKLDGVKYGGNKTDVTAFQLTDLMPSDLTKFFRYDGSFTSPDCDEVITWTVLKDYIKISTAQMTMLRTKMFGNDPTVPLVDNWRPIQSLGSRTVKSSYDTSADTSMAARPVAGVTTLLAVFCAILLH